MEKKKIVLEIIGIVIVTLLLGTAAGGGLFYANYNLIDEGQFASWANHMLLGKQMYKDIYITYGPLFVYPLYLLFKLFGPSLFIVRLYLLIGSIVGLIIVLLIMYRLRIHAPIRYFILSIMILLPIMQLRQGVTLFTIYLLMIALDRNSVYAYFFVGIATVLTFLVSPELGIFVGIILAAILCWSAIVSQNLRQLLWSCFSVMVGVFITAGIFMLWAFSEGWLSAYIMTTSDLFSSFSGVNLPNGMGFPNLLVMFQQSSGLAHSFKLMISREALLYWGALFYIVSMMYVLIIILRDRSAASIRNFSIVMMLGFVMYSILIGRWGIGHFFFILSPLLLLAGYFVSRLLEVNRKEYGNRIVSILLVILLLLFGLRLLFINHPQISTNVSALTNFINGKSDTQMEQQAYLKSVLSFADMHIAKKDEVFILSNEPALYMLLNKTNPTRYDLPYIVVTKDKRYEVLAALTKNPPTYILENTNEWDVDGLSNKERMPEISQFIDSRYGIFKDIEGLRIYKYKPS